MSDYKWTEEDVADAKRRAALKQIELEEAKRAARQIEESFWDDKLVARFPQLEGRTHEPFGAVISFSDGDQDCMCRGPVGPQWALGKVCMLVWHKGSKGKFHKQATEYSCDEIVPFIKQVRTVKSTQAVA